MAQTPATTKKKTPARKKDVTMFEMTSELDDDGNYTAEIFGETFTLSSDVNGWLLMLAGAGDLRAIRNLVDSLIVVEPEEGEKIEVARRRESERFHGLLGSQRHFSIEDAMELVNELAEASGNDQPE